MRRLMVTMIILCFGQVQLISQPDNIGQAIPVKNYRLVWSDEFNGAHLNKSNWNYRGLGKRGDAVNSPDAIRLDGKGHLVIRSFIRENDVVAGIIDTQGRFETKYGYFECRAALTNTPGIWPAFWLQSATNTDNGTPEKNGAEIDIFEFFQNANKDSVSHTLHWGGYGATHNRAGPVWGKLGKSLDGFHVFGVEWTAGGYSSFVDGERTFTERGNVSKVPEFIVLSLEVDKQFAGPLNRSSLPDQFIVDYVRVYKQIQK